MVRGRLRSIGFLMAIAALVSGTGLMLRAEPPQAVGDWALLGASPDNRVGAAAVPLPDGRTLIAGGDIDGTPTDAIVVFNPADQSFAPVGQLVSPRSGHTATLLEDGRVLVAGGLVSGVLTGDLEIIDISTSTSTLAASMTQLRSGHSAARLPNGSVLIAGGTGTDGVLQSTEIFDPETGAASLSSPLLVPRTGATATTLIDGRILVAGGNDGTQDLATAEIFHPASQSFQATDTNLTVPRSGHAAVLLPHNNSVLMVGGMSNGVPQASSDLFLPAEFPDPYSYGMGQFAATDDMAAPRVGAVGGPHDEGYAVAFGGGPTDAEIYRFATIKTDKDDYEPGEPAIITGSGWQPGEQVTLRFQEDPAVHDDYVLTVVADGDGNIYHDQWAPEEHDLNVRFYLIARDSRSRAQITFTDSNIGVHNVSFNASGLPNGTNITINGTTPTPGGTHASNAYVQSFTTPATSANVGAAPSNLTVGTHTHNSLTFTFAFPTSIPGVGGGYELTSIAITAGSSPVTSFSANTSTGAGSFVTGGPNTAGGTATTVTGTYGFVPSDATAPTVTNITLVNASPTSASAVSWTVQFSESVTGVNTADFAVVPSGLGGTPAVTGVVAVDGDTYMVTASTGTGSGSLGLNLVDDDSIADAASNKLGGTGTGNGNFTGEVYTIDRTPPTVLSINRASANPTNASSVDWTVQFSESVTGVDATDFAVAPTGLGGTPAVTGVVAVDGATYTVTASTGTGDGTLGLNLVDNDTIADTATNKLGGTGAGNGDFTGQVYTIDRTAPTGTILINSGAIYTNNPAVTLTLTCSDALSGCSQMQFSETGATYGVLEAVALSKAFNLTGADGSKSVYVKFKDNAGNLSDAFTDSIILDTTPPVITINAPQNSGSYVLNETVGANYSCTDTGGSGVASCTAPVANGANFSTTPVGSHSFEVNAQDNAGNTASVTSNYLVTYAPAGMMCLGAPGRQILEPINADGTSVFKQKSTVPAKFRVCDANGTSIGTPGVVTAFKLVQVIAGLEANEVNESVVSTTPDTAFRWSATDQQWIFNINTKNLAAGKRYVYRITLNDDPTSPIQFEFGLK